MLASSCSAEKQRSYGINEQEMGFLVHVELLSPNCIMCQVFLVDWRYESFTFFNRLMCFAEIFESVLK